MTQQTQQAVNCRTCGGELWIQKVTEYSGKEILIEDRNDDLIYMPLCPKCDNEPRCLECGGKVEYTCTKELPDIPTEAHCLNCDIRKPFKVLL